jgi:hypothetical protein
LLYHVGTFVVSRGLDVAIAGIGGLLLAVMLARAFASTPVS